MTLRNAYLSRSCTIKKNDLAQAAKKKHVQQAAQPVLTIGTTSRRKLDFLHGLSQLQLRYMTHFRTNVPSDHKWEIIFFLFLNISQYTLLRYISLFFYLARVMVPQDGYIRTKSILSHHYYGPRYDSSC